MDERDLEPDCRIKRLRVARDLCTDRKISNGLRMAYAQSRPVFEVLAARQWQDYQRRTPGTYFAEAQNTLTLDEAYAVQMEVAHLRCAAGDAGALWAMPGGAAEAIEWLRGDLDRFGETLKPGDFVLAGTPLGLNPVKPGDHVVVRVDDRKYVECRIS